MSLSYPEVLKGIVAASGDKTDIPLNASIAGAADFTLGFPPITQQPLAAGGIAPARADVNGFLNLLSQHTFWQQSGGLYNWSATLDYAVPSMVVGSDGKLYLSLLASGPSSGGAQDPVSSPTYWLDYRQSVPDASETVAGIIKQSTTAQALAGTDDTTAMSPADVAAVLAVFSGSDDLARDLAATTSIFSWRSWSKVSGPVPGGYQYTHQGADLPTATNATYDSTNKQYVTALTAIVGSSATAAGTASGTNTCVDRGFSLVNGSTIKKLGCYSTLAGAIKLKIVLENTTTSYTVQLDTSISHTGSGWEDFTLSTPFVVPASGTYRMASYSAVSTSYANTSRAYVAGDQTSGTFTAALDSQFMPIMRATYQTGPTNVVLRSAALTRGSVPSKATLYIKHAPVDPTTMGTDIKVRVSRDGGTTWTGYLTPEILCADDATYNWLRVKADLSAIGSGTSLVWEITTYNAKWQDFAGELLLAAS